MNTITITIKPKDCPHENFTIVRTPEGSVHYAKRVCVLCNKFLSWAPNPNPNPVIIAEMELRNERINDLSNKPLNFFERSFVMSIKDKKYLTDKQKAIYQKIVDRYSIPTNHL